MHTSIEKKAFPACSEPAIRQSARIPSGERCCFRQSRKTLRPYYIRGALRNGEPYYGCTSDCIASSGRQCCSSGAHEQEMDPEAARRLHRGKARRNARPFQHRPSLLCRKVGCSPSNAFGSFFCVDASAIPASYSPTPNKAVSCKTWQVNRSAGKAERTTPSQRDKTPAALLHIA